MKERGITRGWIESLLLASVITASAGPIDHLAEINLVDHLQGGGVPKDGIPAVTNPGFVLASEAFHLSDWDPVFGIYIDGEAKAYPESMGWWHEIINDRIGARFVTVTLCPLTGTPAVFDATDDDGSQIEFGVSGLLINSNLVMYDRRDDRTLYPQMIYTAINGAAEGERLTMLPVVHTTFGLWKRLYPDTQVALFGTGLERYSARRREAYSDPAFFDQYPYGNYRTNNNYLLFPWTTGTPDLSVFGTKDLVLGVCLGEELRAYPFKRMGREAVINDELDGQPLLVIYQMGTVIPFSRDVGGQSLTFYQVEGDDVLPVWFRDVETGSLWNMRGEAVDGPLAGQTLQQVPAYNSMWFAWSTFWPQTTVWDGAGIIDAPPPMTAILEPLADTAPEGFALEQNYPNPFNPATRIRFDLPEAAEIHLAIYNATGQRLRTLADGLHRAGTYALAWDGRDDAGRAAASGSYLYRLEVPARGWVMNRSMILLR